MSCTKEEIEKKRLAALQKRQKVLCVTPNKPSASPARNSFGTPKSSGGPIKNNVHNASSSFHPYGRLSNSSKCSNSQFENCVPVGKIVNGTVYLISEDRFEVNPSEFCTPLINVFKTIPSRSYDANTKLWNFSIDDYHELIKKVAPLAPHIVLGSLPPYVLKVLQEPMMDPNNIDLTPVEATLRHKLMPFQEQGVRFGIARRGRCMIADDMGLGKTFQALGIASYYRHNWPLLIVTTSSMRETWQSKIHELLPSVPLMNIATLTTGKDAQLVADRQTEIVIVSYKITGMHTALLKNKKFGVVIIDESHYLKSHKAQCTVALNSITRQCQRVVLLSGTPALSRPAELYTQLALIKPKLFGSYTEYGKRYCAGKQTNFGWDMTGQSNLVELQIILQKKFLIRRTKEQVLTKLEEKTRETVLLDQTLLHFSKEEQQGLSQMAEAYKTKSSTEKHAALVTYFSESARVKIPAICKYIRQVVKDNSGKFLVFAHHKNMIDAICSTLDEERVHYISIVGSTPPAARADLVDRFQHTASCRCAVLSITAANSGLTLTAANLVLFAELHWNPGILTQAESRAHRIGQQGGVCARYLLAPGTADDAIWPMLQNKLNILTQAESRAHRLGQQGGMSACYLLAPGTADDVIWPMLQNKLNVLNDVGLSRDTFEDSTMKHQESKNTLTQYLSPISKNKNDYIPGTNIRKGTLKSESANQMNGQTSNYENKQPNNFHGQMSNGDKSNDIEWESFDMLSDVIMHETSAVEESFLVDDEDDALLANLDL